MTSFFSAFTFPLAAQVFPDALGSGPGQGPSALLGDRFDQALILARALHTDQRRKGSEIPYLAHLLAVSSLVLENGGGEDEAIAALLHDAIEDHPEKITAADLAERFGSRVAYIVSACTDTDQDPKPPWHQRKRAYLEHLEEEDDAGALLVSLSDKVHNLASIVADYEVHGEKLWPRFKHGAPEQLWYYGELSRIFQDRLPGPLSSRLAALWSELNALVDDGPV